MTFANFSFFCPKSNGNQTERFLHGLRIDEVLAQENTGGEVLWALADHQGSVKMLLDNQGNVVNEITYDAFGNITVESNPDINFRFSYTGRELDPETGLYNYRTRFLDPSTGQFISQDTIGFAGGDANLYRYVVNSPINYLDPDGKFVIPATAVVGAAAILAGIGVLLYDTSQKLRGEEGLIKYPPIPGIETTPKTPFSPQQDPNDDDEPRFPPLRPDQEEIEENNDFFRQRFKDVRDWFDRQLDRFRDQNEENQERQEQQDQDDGDGDGGSCGINDRPDFLDDIVDSSEPQPPEGSKNENDNSDSGETGDDVDEDSMWDALEAQDGLSQDPQDDRDPVADAIDHIKKKNKDDRQERFNDLGLDLDNYNDLERILDETYSYPLEVWTRPGEEKGKEVKAYVNKDGETIFIDNPINPTIFPPSLGVEKYLTDDNFIKDPKD